jgi:hypothetical protein
MMKIVARAYLTSGLGLAFAPKLHKTWLEYRPKENNLM